MDDSGVQLEERSAARRVPHQRRAALVLGLVTVVGLLVAGRWWTTPDLFGDSGVSMSSGPRPVPRAALAVAVTFPEVESEHAPTELVFTAAAAAEVATNTARASADVAVCRATPGADVIGSVRADVLGEYCDAVVPVDEGVRMTQGPWDAEHRDYLVVTLTPTRPGKVRLVEVSVSYRTDHSHFYRRGAESIGVDVLIRTH